MAIDQALLRQARARALTGGDGRIMLVRLAPGEPTQAQAESGNYAKKTVKWQGLTIKVENPAGSVRYGHNWQTRMVYDYGYVARTEGVDGDEVDVYLGPALDVADMVYVVHQRKYGDWAAYDEDKCMVGFMTEDDARAAYLKHYDDERFLGPITAMSVPEFVAKVKATRERPAALTGYGTPVLVKGHVGAYLRSGKLVNLGGYHGRNARAQAGEGQLALFVKPKSTASPVNPYKDKDPVLDTIDLFTGQTQRENPTRVAEAPDDMVKEHRRLVAVLRSPSKSDDLAEADRQEQELHEYEQEARQART